MAYSNVKPWHTAPAHDATKEGCGRARRCCEHLAAKQPNDLRLGGAHIEVVQAHRSEQTIRPGQAGIALKYKWSPLHVRPQVQRHSYMHSKVFHTS